MTATARSRQGVTLPRITGVRPSAPDAIDREAAPPPTGLATLSFTVSALLHERLADSARQARRSVESFAATLLGTAYAAHHRPGRDPDLDGAVVRAVILSRTHNTAEIARAVRLSEATVVRVLDAWRAETGSRA